MKEIQAWLGHSDYSTTANLYAHLDLENAIWQSADRLKQRPFWKRGQAAEQFRAGRVRRGSRQYQGNATQ